MSRVSSGTAFRRCAALSLLVLSTGLAACGDSGDGSADGKPTTPATAAATPAVKPNPELEAKVKDVQAAVKPTGLKTTISGPASDENGALRVGPFNVIVYKDVASAKKAQKQFEAVFAESKSKAEPLLERRGNKLVVARVGTEPTAKERKQFDEVVSLVAKA